jgi:hypothetical protein
MRHRIAAPKARAARSMTQELQAAAGWSSVAWLCRQESAPAVDLVCAAAGVLPRSRHLAGLSGLDAGPSA